MSSFPANRQQGLPSASQLATAEPSLDAQALWFELQRREWTSLAVVPAAPGLSTLPVAVAISEVCAAQEGRPLLVLPAEKVELGLVSQVLEQLSRARAGDGSRNRIVVPVGSLVEHPPAVAIARAADCAILCVELHETSIAAARRAIALIGAERFLGYVVLGGGKR